MSHLFLMTLYATLVGLFFAILWRRELKDQAKLFVQLFLGMMLGALALGWLMYPFPSGPPTPIP